MFRIWFIDFVLDEGQLYTYSSLQENLQKMPLQSREFIIYEG